MFGSEATVVGAALTSVSIVDVDVGACVVVVVPDIGATVVGDPLEEVVVTATEVEVAAIEVEVVELVLAAALVTSTQRSPSSFSHSIVLPSPATPVIP